jgi:acyl carrier protein
MTREKIQQIVNEFLTESIEVEAAAIHPDASLKEELGIDSLDFVDIVVIVEQKFGFKIKAEEMTEIRALSQFYDYIESKVKQQNA